MICNSPKDIDIEIEKRFNQLNFSSLLQILFNLKQDDNINKETVKDV
jgi:hypothetical protein